MTAGLLFSSRSLKQQIGASVPFGITFDWFALQAAVSAWGGDVRPVSGQRLELASAVGIELEANARYLLPWRNYLLAGLGAQAIANGKRTWVLDDEGGEQRTQAGETLVFLSFGGGLQFLHFRVVVGLTQPEVRMDAGFLFGRN
jgi:hypothetical protein